MLISVITPSFNSSDFIERAIKSVMEQDYPHWEHIIIDGASNDGTLEVLNKYPHLSWISESDNGQADAMNKGFTRSKGEIVVYLNADDYFFAGAFSAIIAKFKEGVDFVVGNILIKSERMGVEFLNTPRITLEGMLRHWEPNSFCHNPVGYFYRREVQKSCPFNSNNYATMDLEFLLDAAALYSFSKVEYTLGCFMDGLKTKTHQTQTQHNYWQPATFPYLDRHIAHMPQNAREQYLAERRAGYAAKQAESNFRNRQEGIVLPQPSERASISVIIPAFNCQDYIGRAIDSVLKQHYSRLEILVVDDASPDDVGRLVQQRYGHDSRVKVLRHSENKKLGAARNTGLKNALGDYVFFLDADDWLAPGGLRALLALAEQYSADIAACGVQKAYSNGATELYHAFSFACRGGREALWYLADYYIGTIVWNKLYRRQFLTENKLLFIEDYYHEDVIFSMRATALCKNYISTDEIGINYFHNEKSITRSTPAALHLASYLRIWPDIDKFSDEFGLKGDEDGSSLTRELFHKHASFDMAPKLRRYLDATPKNNRLDHIQNASARVFPMHKEMAGDILECIFSQILKKENDFISLEKKFMEVEEKLNNALSKNAAIFSELTKIKSLATSLTKSRAINAISFISPRAQKNALEILKDLEILSYKFHD
ncbi:glycosyltransferase [Variovorax sp. dw_308]|uniref:glycosyltransferase n=1 Tax=Variovorax sp. dw_308 TaxID=2721546 RepID=UPI001C4450BC|nr:glycosyltransferase [Variovorax sp. dw_308]